jgi:hypothetical protein
MAAVGLKELTKLKEKGLHLLVGEQFWTFIASRGGVGTWNNQDVKQMKRALDPFEKSQDKFKVIASGSNRETIAPNDGFDRPHMRVLVRHIFKTRVECPELVAVHKVQCTAVL